MSAFTKSGNTTPAAPASAKCDPVQMYMNKMSRVPLLTREQEVEVCQKIEQAEIETKMLLYSFGFMGKERTALAEKLLAEPPKERFDRVVATKGAITRQWHAGLTKYGV